MIYLLYLDIMLLPFRQVYLSNKIFRDFHSYVIEYRCEISAGNPVSTKHLSL